MTVCKTCKHANYCEIVAGGYSSQVKSCRDYRKGEMTNEEWLRQCTTEQLAEWIASVVQKAISIKENNGIVMLESAIWWGEWLKQPHTPKE